MTQKLLWIGDAACTTGFAKATHHTLDTLRRYWDVTVLGLNYFGRPHAYPYPIYPASGGGDAFGVGHVIELVEDIAPDVVVVQNDPWNVPAYMKKCGSVPVVASMPVDGKNCAGRALNGLALAIFWTQFGQAEAVAGGYQGYGAVIPLGVDLDVYQPQDRLQARQRMGLPPRVVKSFVVGNVNRNQPRKRLDLSIAYFAEWITTRKITDAYLYLHVAPTGDLGWDCTQLAAYYGVANRLVLAEPNIGRGVSEAEMAATYATFDVQLTTTQGEGFGMTTLEGMACGIPQIVPCWAALGEWAAPGSVQVPCLINATTPNNINAIGGLPDKADMVAQLDRLYCQQTWREEVGARGLALAREDRFRWSNIGEKFHAAIVEALEARQLSRRGPQRVVENVSPVG